MNTLDLFSAAAGGWSLGMGRAGFTTIAACEVIEWRRILYAENNPGVRLYDDVRTLTAERLLADLGTLPDVIVGSPPCQDISSANTKGKGVDGERSRLFFEAVRLIGECRPRWFALENSANLRIRGADRVLLSLEAIGYACEPCVVGAGDLGANHERKRSWLIGFEISQLTNPDGHGFQPWRWRGIGGDLSASDDDLNAPGVRHEGGWPWGYRPDGDGAPPFGDATQNGRGSGRPGRRAVAASGLPVETCRDDPHAAGVGCGARAGDSESCGGGRNGSLSPNGHGSRSPTPDANITGFQERQSERGDLEPPASPAPERNDGARPNHDSHADEDREPDGAEYSEMGWSEGFGGHAGEPWPEWNGGFADTLRLDDGLSAWVAEQRIALGGPRGTLAPGLLVEAFGDAVIPQIPEAIGRAILRTEAALAALYGQTVPLAA